MAQWPSGRPSAGVLMLIVIGLVIVALLAAIHLSRPKPLADADIDTPALSGKAQAESDNRAWEANEAERKLRPAH